MRHLGIALALALLGCGDDEQESPDARVLDASVRDASTLDVVTRRDATTAAGPLEGRTFVLQSGHELLPQTSVRISFANGEVRLDPGCNTTRGRYTIADGVLSAPELYTTLVYCDEARHDQERWFYKLLSESPRITFAGDTLTLVRGDDTLVFLDAA